MQDVLNNISSFTTENRWIFWPIVGAIVVSLINIRKIGYKELKRGNHPFQAIVSMIILGGIIGLFIAWLTKVLFH
jgi:RsiW-degrading membrane proteinase PrsW (M82 family)